MAAPGAEAYCTLLMSDEYLPGAMVLAHSLRDNGTKKQLAVLVTLDSLQASTIEELKDVYDHIIPVARIVNKSPQNLYLMNRPDLASTFTKIALWRQTQFAHVVYLDADTVALRAPEELFKNPHTFAAVPDIGWPDCFNSGVLSLKPNMGDYYALLALAQRGISFDGADQGLLNMHFRDWERLSFTYNCTPSGNYQYVPAYRHFQSSISMVHFIGHEKPWIIGREQKGVSGVYEELLGRWWAVYDKHFRIPAYSSEQKFKKTRTVQQYVKGEATRTGYEFDAKTEEPEAPVNSTEPSLTDTTNLAEDVQKGDVTPTSTAQQRRFSVDWDPLRQAPPLNSRPEAPNFPNEVYSMSADSRLFQPPKNPEPPKDLAYQVPKPSQMAKRPKPIFPWETTAPKPTRVFADDPPFVIPEQTPSIITDADTQTSTSSPTTPTQNPEPFATYSRSNAWDQVPEIERYISNLPQNRRAKVQILTPNANPPPSSTSPLFSPNPAEELQPPLQQQIRRPSLLLTDFPTEIERPSLPVTPAPVQRPLFWGAERDAQGDLPGAEGVPEQSDWDPGRKLEELRRRQAEVLEQGTDAGVGSPGRSIPDREVLESASGMVGEKGEKGASEEGVGPTAAPVPVPLPAENFQTLDFSAGAGVEDRGRSAEVAPNES